MAGSEIKLTISPYTPSTLPPEDALVAAGKALLTTLDSWKEGRTFSNLKGQTLYNVRTLSRSKSADDGAAWHSRISNHDEGSFDDFWDGLGRDKALKEQEFIPELVKATMLRSISTTQTLWTLQYKFVAPLSPRVFTVLQVTHLTGGEDGTPREGWIISVPVDVTEDASLKAKEAKGVRGRYVSVERISEGKDGKVEWSVATSSTPGGWIPQSFAERAIPGEISKDVPRFLEWISKKKATVAKKPATDSNKPSAALDLTSEPSAPAPVAVQEASS